MKCYFEINEATGQLLGWGSQSFDGAIEMELAEDDALLLNYPRYKFINNTLIEDLSYMLIDLKKEKDSELNKACQQAILSGFSHVINNEEYHFSYDAEAQVNFSDAKTVLSKGLVQQINWTVKKDGSYTRISIDENLMDELSVAILNHKESNISKYRETLLPLLENATTIEEIENIVWQN